MTPVLNQSGLPFAECKQDGFFEDSGGEEDTSDQFSDPGRGLLVSATVKKQPASTSTHAPWEGDTDSDSSDSEVGLPQAGFTAKRVMTMKELPTRKGHGAAPKAQPPSTMSAYRRQRMLLDGTFPKMQQPMSCPVGSKATKFARARLDAAMQRTSQPSSDNSQGSKSIDAKEVLVDWSEQLRKMRHRKSEGPNDQCLTATAEQACSSGRQQRLSIPSRTSVEEADEPLSQKAVEPAQDPKVPLPTMPKPKNPRPQRTPHSNDSGTKNGA